MSKRVLNKNCNDNDFWDRKLTSPFGKTKQCEYKKKQTKNQKKDTAATKIMFLLRAKTAYVKHNVTNVNVYVRFKLINFHNQYTKFINFKDKKSNRIA
jgi:hypothetical protein